MLILMSKSKEAAPVVSSLIIRDDSPSVTMYIGSSNVTKMAAER